MVPVSTKLAADMAWTLDAASTTDNAPSSGTDCFHRRTEVINESTQRGIVRNSSESCGSGVVAMSGHPRNLSSIFDYIKVVRRQCPTSRPKLSNNSP